MQVTSNLFDLAIPARADAADGGAVLPELSGVGDIAFARALSELEPQVSDGGNIVPAAPTTEPLAPLSDQSVAGGEAISLSAEDTPTDAVAIFSIRASDAGGLPEVIVPDAEQRNGQAPVGEAVNEPPLPKPGIEASAEPRSPVPVGGQDAAQPIDGPPIGAAIRPGEKASAKPQAIDAVDTRLIVAPVPAAAGAPDRGDADLSSPPALRPAPETIVRDRSATVDTPRLPPRAPSRQESGLSPVATPPPQGGTRPAIVLGTDPGPRVDAPNMSSPIEDRVAAPSLNQKTPAVSSEAVVFRAAPVNASGASNPTVAVDPGLALSSKRVLPERRPDSDPQPLQPRPGREQAEPQPGVALQRASSPTPQPGLAPQPSQDIRLGTGGADDPTAFQPGASQPASRAPDVFATAPAPPAATQFSVLQVSAALPPADPKADRLPTADRATPTGQTSVPQTVGSLQPTVIPTAGPATNAVTKVLLPRAIADHAILSMDSTRADLTVPGDGAPRVAPSLPAAPALATPEAARAVALQVVEALRQGSGSIEVTLAPEELGRLRLSIGVSEGAMLVTLSAERPETLDLMRRHIDILQAEARAEGFADLEFAFSGYQSRPETPPPSAEVHTAPGHADLPPVVTSQGSESGLDLRL